MSKLIIVESPAKARTIKKYLGKDYEVLASMGHVRDLPKSELGVDLDSNFEPNYVTIRGKGKILKEIRTASKKAEEVFLAPDPDREGEAIAWHIAEEIKDVNPNIRRVMFHEITRTAIERALSAPHNLDQERFNAQQARRILDRLVGYLVSPVLWRKVRRGLSAGRVQSVAVRMIVEREADVEAFDPVEYWAIQANLIGEGKESKPFLGKLWRKDGKKAKIINEAAAKEVRQHLELDSFIVADVERKEVRRRPGPPYITSTLQQDASRFLRLPATRTMQIAQRLYEGIDLEGEGPVALITYMRTDSVRSSPEAVSAVREYVDRDFGSEYLPGKPNTFKTKKRTQDAHEAIRPTSMEYPPSKLRGVLDGDTFSLYRLIWSRFVASQMVPALYDQTVISVDGGNGLELRTQGRVLKFEGYRKAIEQDRKESPSDEEESDSNQDLPKVEKGEVLKLHPPGVETEQKFTKPPPRFTEATLIKTLEEEGIGRPSTYAAIIQTIQDKNYVEKKKGQFSPTELGRMVTVLLVQSFPDILSVAFTAQMEEQLDAVESGDEDWRVLMERFFEPFSTALEKAEEEMVNLRREGLSVPYLTCEKCNSNMAIKIGNNSVYVACTNYPDCSNMAPYARDEKGKVSLVRPEPLDQNCPKCKAPLVIRNGRFGRFISCSTYPECKHTESLTTGIACPEKGCKGELTEKRSRKGKIFYACTGYPDCKYAIWDRPVDQACTDCAHPFLLEKTRKRGTSLTCPNCSAAAGIKESA
jgi:DNA topoisomerase-1